jgi:hypothetical protein
MTDPFVASYDVARLAHPPDRDREVSVAQRQINIRLPEKDVAVLEASALLDDSALPDLVRSLVLEHVATLLRDPEVQHFVEVRLRRKAEREKKEGEKVTSIGERRRSIEEESA